MLILSLEMSEIQLIEYCVIILLARLRNSQTITIISEHRFSNGMYNNNKRWKFLTFSCENYY